MAVVNKDTIMERLRENFNDNDSDDVLGLLEDVTDTLNDYQSRLEEMGTGKSGTNRMIESGDRNIKIVFQ